jgi:phosphoenolpyruvate carboxykinase (GTP)
MLTQIKTELKDWVDSMTSHFGADNVHWCDGSEHEYDTLCQKMVDKGTFIKLNPEKRPNSFACFSDPAMWQGWKTKLLSAAEEKKMPDRPTTG